MAIIASELNYYYSGGAANSSGDASLGGAVSSVEITSGSLHNLFDIVNVSEATAGDVEYRGIYIANDNASLDLLSAAIYIESDSTSADTDISIALAPEGAGASMETLANEFTEPSGVAWHSLVGAGNSLPIGGDLPFGESLGIWIRRTVSPGASAVASDTASLRFNGGTAA